MPARLAARRADRPAHRALDGIIVVHKPVGPSSHDIVALVRRLSGVKRVGHGGTLDPFASGVLPLFLGHATRVVEYHLGDPKAYRATIALGARSTTDDLDGELTALDGPALDRAAVEAALEAFRGPIVQVPPAHSAVHVGGRRAYELARLGERPVLEPRAVTIHELELIEWDEEDRQRPTAIVHLRCSAGTYVRALARDLGEHLGSGGYLVSLVRAASGPFTIEAAHPLDEVRETLAAGHAERLLLPSDTGLDGFPAIALAASDLEAIARGQIVRPRGQAGTAVAAAARGGATRLRLVDAKGRLAGIGRLEGGRLHPEKVFLGTAR